MRIYPAITAVLLAASTTPSQAPASGFRLLGPSNSPDTWLVDQSGAIVHTWRASLPPGVGMRLQQDGVLLRTVASSPFFGAGGIGGGLQRLGIDSQLLWDFRYESQGKVSHHDVEILPNGNVLLIAWEEKTPPQAIAAGRNPALLGIGPFRPDHVIEVRQTGPVTGQIVWEWHVWDHLVQDFDPTEANWGNVGAHPELVDVNFPARVPNVGDWNHINSVRYDPVHDWIVLSAHTQSEVWVIDHSTTTEQAAGHTGGRWGRGGDLLYRWGNPAAYRAGTAADQKLFGQHGPHVIPQGLPGAGHLLVFNNNPPGGSRVVELELPLDGAGRFVRQPGAPFGPAGPAWSFAAPGFASSFVSNAERLPNGNTQICSGIQSTVFEVTPAGTPVWAYSAIAPFLFHAHYVDRELWSGAPSLSIANGGTVRFDLIAGRAHAGAQYFVLGSLSGTTPGLLVDGLLVPLNYDGYMATTLSSANRYPLAATIGRLDTIGRANAWFSLPAGLLPPQLVGLRFDHAFVTWDAARDHLTLASNAAGFTLAP